MAAEIIAGLGAIKTAFDLAKGLKEIDDATKRNAAVIELQQVILDAQQGQMALLEQVSLLKEQIEAMRANKDDLARYELVDVRGDGKVAYRLKTDLANGEPSHLACPVCFKKGEVSILQFRLQSSGQDWYDCFSCKSTLKFGARTQTQHNRIRPSHWME